jgi:hypothetical protein
MNASRLMSSEASRSTPAVLMLSAAVKPALLDVDAAAQVKQILAPVATIVEKIRMFLQRRSYGPPVQVLDQRPA